LGPRPGLDFSRPLAVNSLFPAANLKHNQKLTLPIDK
jgi:hypothetical protein